MRLAYERGFLTQKKISFFQHWGLRYWIHMSRRIQIADLRATLIQQTFNLYPERWDELYREEALRKLGITDTPAPIQDSVPLEDRDYDALEQFLEQQDKIAVRRWINAGQLPPDYVPDTQGRRV